jgi:hypothetical protein
VAARLQDDGQQVKLVPVGRHGYRLVAFVIPGRAGIAAATAYLSNGQYATTIPPTTGFCSSPHGCGTAPTGTDAPRDELVLSAVLQ